MDKMYNYHEYEISILKSLTYTSYRLAECQTQDHQCNYSNNFPLCDFCLSEQNANIHQHAQGNHYQFCMYIGNKGLALQGNFEDKQHGM